MLPIVYVLFSLIMMIPQEELLNSRPSASKSLLVKFQIKELGVIDYNLRSALTREIKKKLRTDWRNIDLYKKNSLRIVKVCFITALSELAIPQFYPDIVPFLHDSDVSVIEETIHALGQTRDPRYVKLIHDTCLKYKDNPSVMSTAFSALGEFGSKESADFIVSWYQTRDQAVVSSVIRSLGKMGSSYAAKKLVALYPDSLEWEKKLIIENIGACRNSKEAASFISELLIKKNHPFFTEVIRSAGELELDDHLPQLIELLKDKNMSVRQAAADALSYMGKKKAIFPLINSIDKSALHESYHVSAYHSVESIISIYSKKEILEFIKGHDHPSEIACKLGNLKDKSSIKALQDLLNNEDPINRICAVFALSQIGGKEIRPVILTRLPEATELEFFYELPLLKAWYQRSFVSMEELTKLLTTKSIPKQKIVVFNAFIENLDSEDDILPMLKRKHDPFTWVLVYALENWPALPSLTHELTYLLRTGPLPVRYYCARTLTKMASLDKELIPVLSACVHNETNERVKKILNDAISTP